MGDSMRKIWLLLLVILLPMNVVAYSNYVYRGGNTLGIKVNTDGILIVGFYQIDGEYNKGNPSLKIGDYIQKVNGNKVSSLISLTNEIEKHSHDGYVNITYRRNSNIYNTKLDLIFSEGVYKTGLFVKDSIIGIGTLTYIDPQTNIFGALGHEIIESNTSSIVEIKDGNIFKNEIVSIDKSRIGYAGSKNAKYFYNDKYGNIYKNTIHGIFGKYYDNVDNLSLIKVGTLNDIKIGKAEIYTVLKNQKIEKFTVNITNINEDSGTKNITFTIDDEKLVEKTGGVIQGMSGSPIIQNNKIIGVVTHVILDNPLNGYGLFITKMLEEGEK